jgi:D-beta-D-heptose 7-phosphate kinase/D-beta-D-heptose 1-phosphate adenosyltransferase
MSTVMVNGCFDLIHRGHIEHLRQAASFGDKLIVALTEDKFVNKGPGRPINAWADRAYVLQALRCVDYVYPTQNASAAIRLHKPHIFVKGIDYADGGAWTEDVEKACRDAGAQLMFTTTPKKSATDIIRRAMT